MSSGKLAVSANDSLTDRLYDIGFFLVELFAALEVTAVIVANARITESLRLREELSNAIINSYLYPLFAVMLIILLLSNTINRTFNPARFFVAGLTAFFVGNLVCFASATPFAFFAGRIVMGFGGAIAFAGQLWTVSSFHRDRLARPLVWGEAGAALGVVAGPIVGALFSQFSANGWREFFLLNAALALITAIFAYLGLRGRKLKRTQEASARPVERGQSTLRTMTAWQVAVSILVVGSEYLFSDYLQAKMGKSPMFVGGMTVLASVGAIIGSAYAARISEKQTERIPPLTAVGLLGSLVLLSTSLSHGAFFLAGIPIFASGLFMGLANVTIYASIVQTSAPAQFLSRSMVYLMGMQIGNALGVQAVGVAELGHFSVAGTAGVLSFIPIAITVACFARWPRFRQS